VISVIMTVFNGQKFLAESLDSVLSQTYRDFELVIVDDGSSDASPAILRDYAARDPRIQACFPGRLGRPAALNVALREARNEWVAQIDSDDRMLPQRLERQLAFVQEKPDVSVACSYAYMMSSSGKRMGTSRPTVDVERGKRELRPELFLEIMHSTVLMRRAHVLEVGGYRETLTYAEDRDLWGRLVTNGRLIECQPEYLVEYRLHSTAMTMIPNNRTQLTCQGIDTNIIRRLKGERELSEDELQNWYDGLPFWERTRRYTKFLATHNFQNASRLFADRRYGKSFLALASAVALRPSMIINRLAVKLRRQAA
jgi:glycosyltransferase involved in cell wall biosynthesis